MKEKEEHITIKEVNLNNNCPECFSKDGLQLTFRQKFIDTAFYKSITAEVSQKMVCKTCNSIIYPERWTEDIERVFEYQQKAFVPKKTSYKLKKNAWVAIGSLVIIIIMAIAVVIILF